MALPVAGDTINGIYQYTVDLSQNVGTTLAVTALDLDAANQTATFGTDGSGNLTVTINGTTQTIDTIGAAQSPTAFTYTSGGTTYLLSNGAVAPSNVADVTIGNLTALIGGLGDIGVTPGATDYVACYLAGTLILTDRGECPVETLAIGDRLVTASGALRPVKWIGTRVYGGPPSAVARRDIMPIRIKRGALADGIPRRDLFVSPHHAMLIDGVLLPAGLLVNGTSISAVTSIDEIHYVHLELDSHDVILAEGAPSESFVDDNSRAMFQNAAAFRALYPQDQRVPARYCAPRHESGYVLDGVTQRLAARGNMLQPDGTARALGSLIGALDSVTPGMISGWAQSLDAPGDAVALTIWDNDVLIAETNAAAYRADLQSAGIGDGRHAFSVAIHAQLNRAARHVIRIRRRTDGADLPGSPVILDSRALQGYREAA